VAEMHTSPYNMKEITDDDLILYHYNEAPPLLKALVEKELASKKELKHRYLQLRKTLSDLNQLPLTSPAPSTIQKILRKTGLSGNANPAAE
jgi:aspartyl-tRNA synthetase